ncbi:PQQ-dependent sugar dehydrogenase [Georgenia sp. SUBG003]|uniref:PQQ-dependent sugar dehydrogenase n=1 Tax=Georgenia sp. SUBG003 TaxID=1497974 RepID=UPI003AB7AEFB
MYATTDLDNRVLRLRLSDDVVGPPAVVLDGIPRAGNHNGGRLAFGPDGHLYVTTGDAGEPGRAQDLESLGGKILRIDQEGRPAPGNPFAGSPVWSYGHRNVQGIGWDEDGRMYASEFGQNTYDELNLIEPGANYGWPRVEGAGGVEGFVDPMRQWSTAEASPSGIAVVDDAVYLAALRGESLWRVPLAGGGRTGEPVRRLDVTPRRGGPRRLLRGGPRRPRSGVRPVPAIREMMRGWDRLSSSARRPARSTPSSRGPRAQPSSWPSRRTAARPS